MNVQYDDVYNSTCEWASALHPLPISRQRIPSSIDGMAMMSHGKPCPHIRFAITLEDKQRTSKKTKTSIGG